MTLPTAPYSVQTLLECLKLLLDAYLAASLELVCADQGLPETLPMPEQITLSRYMQPGNPNIRLAVAQSRRLPTEKVHNWGLPWRQLTTVVCTIVYAADDPYAAEAALAAYKAAIDNVFTSKYRTLGNQARILWLQADETDEDASFRERLAVQGLFDMQGGRLLQSNHEVAESRWEVQHWLQRDPIETDPGEPPTPPPPPDP